MIYTADEKIKHAEHITHQHIGAVINTLLPEVIGTDLPRTVRILDLGCGDGKLLSHLVSSLSRLQPDLNLDVFGLDVSDAGQQDQGFIDQTALLLLKEHPQVSWKNRLTMITTEQTWPYDAESFDFIVSNQVMEHVMDHDFVFREINRCLRPGGLSIHLFPIRESLWEGHALMPLVHQIRDVDHRARLMYFFARLGFNRHYYREMNRRGWTSLREFAHIFARVLESNTNYITTRQLRDIADRAGLAVSFSYTKDLYSAKALSYLGKRYYSYREMGLAERLSFFLFRLLGGITVILRKAS
jgi:SAM-dependent methyltransferase